MNIPQLLNEFKRQNNLTNDYIADYCGVTRSTVSRWCNGKIRRIAPEALEKIGEMLNVSFDDLTSISKFAFTRPILGEVKAGYGLYADENIEGYAKVSEDDYNRGDFFLRVVGDSMKGAHIHDGDLLYVRQCVDLPSGTIGIFLIGGEEVTVKKLIKKEDYWILQAANDEIEPRVFTLREVQELPVQVLGRAIYCRTEFTSA
ncbi:LexA family protein [Allobaculum mucilyticum]|uniref:LexA family protein n=1 Tax=Allobaculum mucilyticum TaxID=2834459 RepID=UPI001E3125CB|nr:LexA family transcriptional regulator [Allobaculum mucilyticum]UNT95205.1 helix-turn-helix domain-containing protein [Allobaculum mucilyticum]